MVDTPFEHAAANVSACMVQILYVARLTITVPMTLFDGHRQGRVHTVSPEWRHP